MPATTPMRSNEVVGCLDRWFSNPDARRLAAQTMAEALERLGHDSQAWALLAIRSQWDGLQRLQLMIGNTNSTSLRQDGATIIYFLKADEPVAERAASACPGVELAPGAHGWPALTIPERHLGAVLDETLTAHRRHLRERAPRTGTKRTIRHVSHSRPAVQELERVLGRPVPSPAYA